MVRRSTPVGKVPAIERAAKILEVLALGTPASLAVLTERVNLSKSSVSDLCASLAGVGLIRRFQDQTFTLGHGILDIAGRMAASSEAEDLLSARSMGGVALESHTISLEQLYGHEVLTLNVRMGRHPVKLTPRPGMRTPVLESAGGLAILASMSRSAVEHELDLFARNQGITERERDRIMAAVDEAVPATGTAGAGQIAVAVRSEQPSFTAITLHLASDDVSDTAVHALSEELRAFVASNA